MDHHRIVDLGDITILSGQTISDTMDFRKWRSAASAVTIYGPAALTGAVNVQVSQDGSVWVDLQEAGADITIAASEAENIITVGWKYLRLLSTLAEAANRVFHVIGEEGQ